MNAPEIELGFAEPAVGQQVVAEPDAAGIEDLHEPVHSELAQVDRDRRRQWADRIQREQRLPGALRERLAAAVEEAADVQGDAEPRLTLSQVANVFAEAVPSLLAITRLQPAPHPGGEVFFSAGQLSDDDAARIASEQLARAGFDRVS